METTTTKITREELLTQIKNEFVNMGVAAVHSVSPSGLNEYFTINGETVDIEFNKFNDRWRVPYVTLGGYGNRTTHKRGVTDFNVPKLALAILKHVGRKKAKAAEMEVKRQQYAAAAERDKQARATRDRLRLEFGMPEWGSKFTLQTRDSTFFRVEIEALTEEQLRELHTFWKSLISR